MTDGQCVGVRVNVCVSLCKIALHIYDYTLMYVQVYVVCNMYERNKHISMDIYDRQIDLLYAYVYIHIQLYINDIIVFYRYL